MEPAVIGTMAPDVISRAETVLSTFRSTRAAAVDRYGPLSKASYVVTFAALCSLFQLHLECLDTDNSAWMGKQLEALRGELHAMFLQMTQPPRPENRRAKGTFAGAPCDLLTFDGELAETRAGRQALRDGIVPLDEVLRIGGPPATYLYCLTERDRFILYAAPMSYRDMMAGTVAKGYTVKHTMLPEENEAVVCAGEVHLALSPAGLRGAIVPAASGHYQPEAPAELLVRDHLVRAGAMRGDAICLLSHSCEAG